MDVRGHLGSDAAQTDTFAQYRRVSGLGHEREVAPAAASGNRAARRGYRQAKRALDFALALPSFAEEITVAGFESGQHVHITGTSKGKGFAGVMKRHNFSGGPGGHGSHAHREPGSVGQASTPSRVFKGVRLPGRMGGDTVTVRNLEIVRVDTEQNLLLVRGAVPGGKDGLLTIRLA